MLDWICGLIVGIVDLLRLRKRLDACAVVASERVPVRNRRRSVRVPVAAVTAPRRSLIVREGETVSPQDVAELEIAWNQINTRALRSRYDSRSYGEA